MRPATPSFAKRFLTFPLVFLGVYGLVLVWFYFTQASRIYFPPPSAPQRFDVVFKRPDGMVLGGWVSPGRTPDAALVVFGGNAQGLFPWKSRQGLAGCTDRTLILVPYRGYEGNPGVPREHLLIDDGQAVVAWAKERYAKVGLLGISLGSGVATAVAAREGEDVDLLALGTPYDRLDRVAQDLMPWVFPSLLMRDRYASVDRIAAVKAPIRVLRAQGDRLIQAPRTAALLQAAQPRTPEETVLPGGHEDVWRTGEACAWLQKATATNP